MLEGDGGTRRGDRIDELFAWCSVDPDDDCEGLLATDGFPGLGPQPMIGADRRRIEQFRDEAQAAAKSSGREVRLLRFHAVEEIEKLCKGLTLTQPWAALMACGAKRVETRSWNPPDRMIGQAVAIHAAKSLDSVGGEAGLRRLCGTFPFDLALWKGGYIGAQLVPRPPRRADPPPAYNINVAGILEERGNIIAEAVLLEVRPAADMRDQLTRRADHKEIAFGDYTPGRWAWVFDEVYRLPVPRPCKGMLGLWDVPDDIADDLAHAALTEGRDHL